MALRGRRPGRTFARSDRPATNWARIFNGTAPVVVAAGTKVLMATFTLSNPGINEVIRRTRGMISVTSDQGGLYEDQMIAFGMIVVTDLALAAGAASIPGPATDASDDGWFVWEGITQLSSATFNVAPTEGDFGLPPYHFDSKAMRKVPEGYGVAVMVENESSNSGAEIMFAVSLLGQRR